MSDISSEISLSDDDDDLESMSVTVQLHQQLGQKLEDAMTFKKEEIEEDEAALQAMLAAYSNAKAEALAAPPQQSANERMRRLREEKQLEEARVDELKTRKETSTSKPTSTSNRDPNIVAELKPTPLEIKSEVDEDFEKMMKQKDEELANQRRLLAEKEAQLARVKRERIDRDKEIDREYAMDTAADEELWSTLEAQRRKEKELLEGLGTGARAFQEWASFENSNQALSPSRMGDDDLSARLAKIELEQQSLKAKQKTIAKENETPAKMKRLADATGDGDGDGPAPPSASTQPTSDPQPPPLQ
eukprot:GFYU01001993.1.p1 GENE.GFYU01001993.1~~GFYU01001993.1.p1  ORF type:complete len:303 (+),score=77.55 GFYU01001993.1:27-935(+)